MRRQNVTSCLFAEYLLLHGADPNVIVRPGSGVGVWDCGRIRQTMIAPLITITAGQTLLSAVLQRAANRRGLSFPLPMVWLLLTFSSAVDVPEDRMRY